MATTGRRRVSWRWQLRPTRSAGDSITQPRRGRRQQRHAAVHGRRVLEQPGAADVDTRRHAAPPGVRPPPRPGHREGLVRSGVHRVEGGGGGRAPLQRVLRQAQEVRLQVRHAAFCARRRPQEHRQDSGGGERSQGAKGTRQRHSVIRRVMRRQRAVHNNGAGEGGGSFPIAEDSSETRGHRGVRR